MGTRITVLSNSIWEEFSTAFCYSHKIRYYIDRKRKFNRFANGAIIVLSLTSAISFNFNLIVATFASILTAVVSVTKQIMPIFIQSDSELVELHKVATFYAEYQVKLEKIYFNIVYENVNPVFIEPEFFKIKEEAAKYLAITNKYFRGIPNKADNKINNQFDEYVKRIYNQNSGT